MGCLFEIDNMGMRLREHLSKNLTAFIETGKTEKVMRLWKHRKWGGNSRFSVNCSGGPAIMLQKGSVVYSVILNNNTNFLSFSSSKRVRTEVFLVSSSQIQ